MAFFAFSGLGEFLINETVLGTIREPISCWPRKTTPTGAPSFNASLASSVSVLATGLGLSIGFILSKSALPRKNFLRLLLLPLFLPAYIITVAWVDFLLFLGLSTPLIYNAITVVFVLTIIYTPVAILIFSSAIAHISASQEEAAWLMAPYPQVFFRIVLPLIKPALISSFLLIFLLAISEFTVPAFLSVSVLTTDIFIQFSAFYNYQAAIAQSSFLIIICLVCLIIERRLLGDRPFLTVTGRSHRNRLVLSPATNGITTALLVTYLFLSTFIPLAFLTYQSLAKGFDDILKAFFLLQAEMLYSFWLAVCGAFILVGMGLGFAYFKNKKPFPVLDFGLLWTFSLPSVVAGIALIRFYNTSFLYLIYASPAIILIAYLMRYVFIAERLLTNRLLQLPDSLEQAALIQGAGHWTYLRLILLPLVADALFGAFLISFIFCIGELGTTIMVYPPGTSLLPIKIFTLMANAPQSLVSSLCLVTLLFAGSVLALLNGAWRLVKRGRTGFYG